MRSFVAIVAVLVVCSCATTTMPVPSPPPTAQAAPTPAPPVDVKPAIEGVWRGVLGGKLHLTLEVRRDGDRLSGLLDSVDQGSVLPIDTLRFEGGLVHFVVAAVEGTYEGAIDSTGRLDGKWAQKGALQPLSFQRDPTAEPRKPEPPKRPLDAPVELAIEHPPTPLRAGDGTHLVYELHVTNFSRRAVSLESLEVLSDGGSSLARYDGEDLAALCTHPGGPEGAGDERRRLGPGMRAVLYLWVTVGDVAPHALDHRLTLRLADDPDPFTVRAARVPVGGSTGPALSPPLRGRWWKAANGPSNTSHHRRALLLVAGHPWIAQRFAIDWVKVGEDGKSFAGDATKNSSYLAYGQDALAVADGVVVEVKDGIPENVPGASRAVPITLDTVAGNHVVVDLGGGRFAFWAHFQPGTVKVKMGDKVKRGQVLGIVGNSGNSTQPHLHFHVSDSRSPLGSEGVSYALESYELSGGKRFRQLPLEDQTVAFP